MTEEKEIPVFIVSDGTGETVDRMVSAILTQWSETKFRVTRYKSIRSLDQAEAIVDEGKNRGAVIVFTLVLPEVREKILSYAKSLQVECVDLIGPLLDTFSKRLGSSPTFKAGLLHAVNEAYFKRIEAMEFTVKHDDGANTDNLHRADIILVGVSRTSKTPLSIYLSHRGWKVANVPLVPGIQVSPGLFEVDQNKIIGLTIDPEALARIRRERLARMGRDPAGEYASIQKIREEIEWARQLFERNRRWPVFDVTNKALEETAAEIERIIQGRRIPA
jgi:[pyruvate, water dikinase]-phosphate phosphotransferase / [pyruvate, water dikinase] kinase